MLASGRRGTGGGRSAGHAGHAGGATTPSPPGRRGPPGRVFRPCASFRGSAAAAAESSCSTRAAAGHEGGSPGGSRRSVVNFFRPLRPGSRTGSPLAERSGGRTRRRARSPEKKVGSKALLSVALSYEDQVIEQPIAGEVKDMKKRVTWYG